MRILLAWELGDNFGHIGKLIELGEALKLRGADVTLALQNPYGVGKFIGATSLKILPAPYGRVKPKPQSKAVDVLSFADDVGLCGYDNPDGLAGLIRAWDGIFTLVQPDILVANSAPTALLAAQPYPFKKVSTGLGYEVPPQTTPMAPLRFWEQADMQKLQAQEQAILGNINGALKLLGRPPLHAFCEMLQADAEILNTFAELDHYGERNNAAYYGSFYSADQGEAWHWQEPHAGRARIFAYIYPGRAGFTSLCEALQKAPHDSIMVSPGLTAADAQKLSTGGLRVASSPLKLALLKDQADLCITHGGMGTVTQFLLRGVPQLILPNHIEQMMTARRVAQHGLGVMATGRLTPAQLSGIISKMLLDTRLKQKTMGFAEKYHGYDQTHVAGQLAEKIMSLCPKVT